MAEVISNTSPLQYLHQLGLLHVLEKLAGRIIVPNAVVAELGAGAERGVDVPSLADLDWIEVRTPTGAPVLRLVTDLGPGETQALALAIESRDAIVLLDDAVARRVAQTVGIPVRGTLGVLLDPKRAGLISAAAPLLDKLDELRFRVSRQTRAAILRAAGELP